MGHNMHYVDNSCVCQNIRVNRYRGLTSATGLKPLEDTIYVDSVPVIKRKSGTDWFLYSIR